MVILTSDRERGRRGDGIREESCLRGLCERGSRGTRLGRLSPMPLSAVIRVHRWCLLSETSSECDSSSALSAIGGSCVSITQMTYTSQFACKILTAIDVGGCSVAFGSCLLLPLFAWSFPFLAFADFVVNPISLYHMARRGISAARIQMRHTHSHSGMRFKRRT